MPSWFSVKASPYFRAPAPQTMHFVSSLIFPFDGSWPEALMPCVVPHSFLLTGTSCLSQVSLQGWIPPQRNSSLQSHKSVLISFGFRAQWLPSVGTKRGIPRFLLPCSGQPASQRKVKLCFHSGAVLYSPSTWNMWGMMWGTNQNYLAKALMKSLHLAHSLSAFEGRPHAKSNSPY